MSRLWRTDGRTHGRKVESRAVFSLSWIRNFNVLTMMAPTMPSCSNTESDVSNQVDDNGGDDDVGHEDDDDGGDDDADHANKLRRWAWSWCQRLGEEASRRSPQGSPSPPARSYNQNTSNFVPLIKPSTTTRRSPPSRPCGPSPPARVRHPGWVGLPALRLRPRSGATSRRKPETMSTSWSKIQRKTRTPCCCCWPLPLSIWNFDHNSCLMWEAMKHDSLYILPCTQLCMIINENDDDCNGDDDEQSAVQLLLPEATIWSWGQSRLLSIDVHCATPQKDSKAEIELEGWVISNVCKPIRCICTACNSNQVWFWRRQVQKTDNIVLILWWPITLTTIVIALLITILREGSGYQIGWIF